MLTRAIWPFALLCGFFAFVTFSLPHPRVYAGDLPPINVGPIEPILSPTPTAPPGITPSPTPTDDTPTPTPSASPSVPVETDDDTTTYANGYVTTFHAGKPTAVTLVDGTPAYALTPNVTVTTIDGAAVGIAPGVLFVDNQGNPVNLATVRPGTRMQSIEVVDDPTLGPVVRKILVDQ